MHKRISELKAGDIVSAHGGTFRVIEDALESQAHRPRTWESGIGHKTLAGPCDCAYARAVCVSGTVPGYFWPGSDWTFQGTWNAGLCDIVSE